MDFHDVGKRVQLRPLARRQPTESLSELTHVQCSLPYIRSY